MQVNVAELLKQAIYGDPGGAVVLLDEVKAGSKWEGDTACPRNYCGTRCGISGTG